jgi:hypothetical protein
MACAGEAFTAWTTNIAATSAASSPYLISSSYGFGLCDQICNQLDAGALSFRGGDSDMTRVNGASIEGQRKSFEKLGI